METFCLTDCIFVILFVSFASKIYANIHLRILVNSIYHFHEKQLKQPLLIIQIKFDFHIFLP